MNIVLVCEDNFDGMMCAVYDAWIYMNKGYKVHIHPGMLYDYNFLSEYIPVNTDLDKAMKVAESIKNKISVQAYMMVYRACMHSDENRVDVVVEFLKHGYKVGARSTKDLGFPPVMELMKLDKKVMNEAHNFKGFIRFKDINNNVLFAKIKPACDVLPLISHHFENRFPLENWIIYDEGRDKAIIHKVGSPYMMVSDMSLRDKFGNIDVVDGYEDLWKIFFDTVGIESRKNDKCQKNHVPLWYRKNMIEIENVQNVDNF